MPVCLCIALATAVAFGQQPQSAQRSESGTHTAPPIAVQVTEEGQHVAFDGYTWQRRELAKRLPLDQPWPGDDKIAKVFATYGLATPPMPASLPAPSMILPGIYLVEGFPNNAYLIDAGPDGLVLFDPGLSMNYNAIVANVKRLGYADSKIHWVINTHAHADHSQADELFRKAGAEILIGEQDADAVEKATLVTAFKLMPAPMQVDYPHTKVSDRISDGEVLHLGNRTLYAIHTPGHTAGSTCFLMQAEGKNILFSGDTLLYDHRLGFQELPDADNHAYLVSLTKLTRFSIGTKAAAGPDAFSPAPIRWDILLPGHGALVLDHADRDVRKGLHTLEIDAAEGLPVSALPFATDEYRSLMFGRP